MPSSSQGPMLRVLPLLVITLAALLAADAVAAADLPKRKPGLWEINARTDSKRSMGTVLHCIDENTDHLLRQQPGKGKETCSVIEVRPQGERVTIHTVCKMQGTTATSDGVFVGSFATAYQGAVLTRFNPPLQGISESQMSVHARWLGPCKPGQKPGDVIMPGRDTGDARNMISDPKVQEMMRRGKPGG